VSNAIADTLSVLSTATLAVTATVQTGTQPDVIAVTPSGKALYVTNQTSSTVSVIAA
jgi:YVTN family beta-propeller protein